MQHRSGPILKLPVLAFVVAVHGAVVDLPGVYARADGPRATAISKTPRKSDATGDALHPKVRFVTSLGDFLIELDGENAPGTVLHFIEYLKEKYYDGTIFHRVMKDTIIQGGGYTADMVEKTRGRPGRAKEAWRSSLRNTHGSIAMLRGRGPGGGGTGQFYINLVDNIHLDAPRNRNLFAVFGKLIGGDDTIEKIRNVPVSSHPAYADGRLPVVPVTPIVIKSVRLEGSSSTAQIERVVGEWVELRKFAVETTVQKLEKQTGRKAQPVDLGVRVIDIAVGSGPPVLVTDTIMFNYDGKLMSGTTFESTLMTEPKVLPVADLIDGLRAGILNMNEGGRRYVIVPPDAGYGESGVPGLIPPDATLFYEVEILEIRATP